MQIPVNKRWVYYAVQYSLAHLMLVKRGWREEHCIVADGEVLVKLTQLELVL